MDIPEAAPSLLRDILLSNLKEILMEPPLLMTFSPEEAAELRERLKALNDQVLAVSRRINALHVDEPLD